MWGALTSHPPLFSGELSGNPDPFKVREACPLLPPPAPSCPPPAPLLPLPAPSCPFLSPPAPSSPLPIPGHAPRVTRGGSDSAPCPLQYSNSAGISYETLGPEELRTLLTTVRGGRGCPGGGEMPFGRGGGWELSDGAVPLCTQFGDIPKGCRGVGGTQGVMG